MDKKLILELKNHYVYYVRNDVTNYYITIPKHGNKTNICIEIKNKMNNYNLDMNDELWVMENVKNTFSYIDDYNITLVLPILSEENVSILEKIDSSEYEIIDKIFGYIINSAYLNLKEANIELEKQIVLVNNDRYKSFINWFTTRYKERVICKNLLELIRLYNMNATSYKKLETPGMTFVVGSYNAEVNAPKVEKEEPPEVVPQKLAPSASGGFTSYLFLTIVTIVIATVVAVIAFMAK